MPNAQVLDPSVYIPRTKPFDHQADIFRRTALVPARALFADTGTGKTKILLDIAAFLTETNRIRGILVVADNGLHQAWIDDEVPVHWPERLPLWTQVWRSGAQKTRAYAAHLDELTAWKHAALFAMNVEAIASPAGFKEARRFLRLRAPALMIIDESTSIKTPKAARTKAAHRLGLAAEYKRIATALPAAEGPLDLYAQFKFLGPELLGFNSYTAFKHEYGIWEAETTAGGRSYPVLRGYKNLEQLMRRVDKHSDQVDKAKCLDLPPKLYEKQRFELSAEQAVAYNQLRQSFILERAQSHGQELVTQVLVRQLRLYQITCGFTPSDPVNWGDSDIDITSDPRVQLEYFKTNARLNAFASVVPRIPRKSKIIVWACFRADVTAIMRWLAEHEEEYGSAVRYDGAVTDKQRAANKQLFRDKDNTRVRWFVGNPRVGSRGLNLQAANYMIYYSNDWPLERRLNSEDRFYRAGQTQQCTVIDIVASGPGVLVDEHRVKALREKKKLQDMILNRPNAEWI